MTVPATPDPARGATNLERTRRQLKELDALLQQMLALPTDDPPDSPEPSSAALPALELAAPAGSATSTVAVAEAPPEATGESRSISVTFSPAASGKEPSVRDAEPPPVAAFEPELKVARKTPPAVEIGAKPFQAAEPPVVMTGRINVPAAGQGEMAGLTFFENEPDDPANQTEEDRAEPDPETALSAWQEVGNHANAFDFMSASERGEGESTLAPPSLAVRGSVSPRPSLLYRALLGLDGGYESVARTLGPLGRPLASPTGRTFLGWLGVVLLIAAAGLALGTWLAWPR